MLKIILSFIAYDIWFYIAHILLHSKFMYTYHKRHHAIEPPTAWDTYNADVLENSISGIGFVVPMFIFEYTLLEFMIIVVILNVRGVMRHDDRFTFIMGNHHLLHHKYPNYNFGSYWTDYLCGTLCPYKE